MTLLGEFMPIHINLAQWENLLIKKFQFAVCSHFYLHFPPLVHCFSKTLLPGGCLFFKRFHFAEVWEVPMLKTWPLTSLARMFTISSLTWFLTFKHDHVLGKETISSMSGNLM